MSNPIDITGGIPNARPSRGIPRPFQRKRIEVGQKGPKREWRWVLPRDLLEGDILPEFGSVQAVMEWHSEEGFGLFIDIVGGEDNEMRVPELTQLWAFTYPPKPADKGESEVTLHAPEA